MQRRIFFENLSKCWTHRRLAKVRWLERRSTEVSWRNCRNIGSPSQNHQWNLDDETTDGHHRKNIEDQTADRKNLKVVNPPLQSSKGLFTWWIVHPTADVAVVESSNCRCSKSVSPYIVDAQWLVLLTTGRKITKNQTTDWEKLRVIKASLWLSNELSFRRLVLSTADEGSTEPTINLLPAVVAA